MTYTNTRPGSSHILSFSSVPLMVVRLWVCLLFCSAWLSGGLAASAQTAPSAPSLSVTGTGDGTASLSWTAVPGADSYQVYRSTTEGGPYQLLAYAGGATSLTDGTYPLATLQDSVTYYYVVTANGGGSGSGYSNEVQAALTLAPPVLSLAATVDGSVSLSWAATPGADSYQVYRASTSGGPYQLLAYAGSGTNFTDGVYPYATLQNNVAYYYVVEAFDRGGASGYSDEVGFTPSLNPPVLSVSGTGDGTASLSWTAVPGADSYQIYRASMSGGPYSLLAYAGTGTSLTDGVYPLATLQDGTAYYYVVVAFDRGGDSGDSNEVSVTPSLSPPALSVSGTGDGSVSLSWTAAPGADNYNVYRSTTEGGPYQLLAYAGTSTSLTDGIYPLSTLQNGTGYFYVVEAFNRGGGSGYSNEASAAPALAAPVLQVASTGDGTASLSWSSVSGADSYSVYRASTSGAPYQLLAYAGTSTALTDGAYPLATLQNNFSYYYVVEAFDRGGGSGYSNEVSVTPTLAAPILSMSGTGDGTASLSWTAVPGVDSYQVYRSTTEGGPYQLLAYAGGATSLTDGTYPLATLSPNAAYYYVVEAFNRAGDSGYSNEVSRLPATSSVPPAPVGLIATWGSGAVSLAWTPTDGATSYNVKRSTTSGGPYTTIASGVTATSYTDNVADKGTTLYYVVSAVNAIGEGPNSNEAAATFTGLSAPTLTGVAGVPGSGQVSLSWTPVAGAGDYNVFAATQSGGPYSFYGWSGSTGTTLSGLQNGQTYYFVVAAYSNSAGNGAYSNEVPVTPANLSAPASLTVSTDPVHMNATLNWAPVSGAGDYNVFESSHPGGPYSFWGWSGTTSDTITGLSYNTPYYFVVAAYSSTGGNGPYSNEVCADITFGAPVLSGVPSDGQMALSWTTVPDAGDYNIFGSNQAGGPYSYWGYSDGTSFTASGLRLDTPYYFVVAPYNTGGQGLFSNEVTNYGLYLNAASAAVTLGPGQCVTSTIGVQFSPIASTSFPLEVPLNLTGLPSGVVAWLYPPSVTLPGPPLPHTVTHHGSTLFLYRPAATTVTPGVYPLTITGTSESGTSQTTVTLTVP